MIEKHFTFYVLWSTKIQMLMDEWRIRGIRAHFLVNYYEVLIIRLAFNAFTKHKINKFINEQSLFGIKTIEK